MLHSLSEIDHYEVFDGNSWQNVGLDTSYSIGGLTDGLYTVLVRAYDKAGNVNQEDPRNRNIRQPSSTLLGLPDHSYLGCYPETSFSR